MDPFSVLMAQRMLNEGGQDGRSGETQEWTIDDGIL